MMPHTEVAIWLNMCIFTDHTWLVVEYTVVCTGPYTGVVQGVWSNPFSLANEIQAVGSVHSYIAVVKQCAFAWRRTRAVCGSISARCLVWPSVL